MIAYLFKLCCDSVTLSHIFYIIVVATDVFGLYWVMISMQLAITTLENPILHISNTFDRPQAVFLLQTFFIYYMFVGVLVCDVISCNSYFIWCLGKDVFP